LIGGTPAPPERENGEHMRETFRTGGAKSAGLKGRNRSAFRFETSRFRANFLRYAIEIDAVRAA
jgi:hypothetical protein